MSAPSINAQLDRTRSLLHELQNSLLDLPADCQPRLASDLQRFSGSLDSCIRGNLEPLQLDTGELKTSGLAPGWLERSLSEVRVGTWHWDANDDRVVWSAEMYRLYGLVEESEPPMTNERFTGLIHPEERQRVNDKLQDCMRHGETYIDEFRVVKPGGEIIWISSVAMMQVATTGKVVRVEGINQDVTARKLAEHELRQSRAREQAKVAELEAILDAVPSLVWVSRDPDCREIIGSRYGYEFLKMSRGDNLSASAPQEQRTQQAYSSFKDGLPLPPDQMPMQVAARTGLGVRDYEYDVRFENGETRHLLGNVVPLLDQSGNPNGAVGAFIDITERKRMEDEFRKSAGNERMRAAELQAVLDAVPSPIFLTRDADGYEITGNLAAYTAMRAQPGSNLSRLRTGKLKAPIRQSSHDGAPLTPDKTPLQVALKTGKTVTDYEWKLEFEDGSHSILWGNATPIRDDEGRITGAVSTFIDISARTAIEEELRQTARRNAFRVGLRDALRPITDPEEIKRTAAEILGRELKASRVFYATVVSGDEEVILEPGYADGVAMLTGRFRLENFSRQLQADHPNGQPYMICDIPHDPKLSESQRAAYLGVGVHAHLDVPLIKDNRFTALLSVHQSAPRQWTEDEVLMAIETAERTWANVERAHAEAALRESEARFHTSIESLMESFVLYTAIREARNDGKPGRIVDLHYDYVNEGACRIAGKTREQMLGHTILKVLPEDLGQALFERFTRVIETGQSLVERFTFGDREETSRVYDLRAVKLGDGLVVTRSDVTEQVRIENERQYALTQMEIHHRLAEQSEKERQSYARDLHDGPIQTLASIAYNLQYVKEVFPDLPLRPELEQIGNSVRSAIQELRHVINELRPPSAIQLGLAKAIQLHAEDIHDRSPQIKWEYNLAEDGSLLPVPVCLAMFRIYQEAVNNIVRHSQASCAWIDFRLEKQQAILAIQDDGKGMPQKPDLDLLTRDHHFGIAGMSERAEEIGARLKIQSEAGKGTKIEICVPIPAKADRGKSITISRRH